MRVLTVQGVRSARAFAEAGEEVAFDISRGGRGEAVLLQETKVVRTCFLGFGAPSFGGTSGSERPLGYRG